MANEKILLQARMRDAGVERDVYRKMTVDEMKTHLNKAKGKAAPAKKTAPVKASNGNGASAKKAAPSKTVSKSVPAKSAPKGQAKRPTAATATKKANMSLRPRKGETARDVLDRVTKAAMKAPAQAGAKKAVPKAQKNLPIGRATIDNSKVDWTAESRVGATPGKRQDVMEALRQFEGDVDQVFELLVANAVKWYPNALNSFPGAKSRKNAAEQNLRWLINRVKYDFASKSGQHVSGTRAKFGESTNANAIYQRDRRERLHAKRGVTQGKTPAKRSAPAKKAPVASKAPARKATKTAPVKKTPVKGRR
jgi:hypothetical protein